MLTVSGHRKAAWMGTGLHHYNTVTEMLSQGWQVNTAHRGSLCTKAMPVPYLQKISERAVPVHSPGSLVLLSCSEHSQTEGLTAL